MGKLKEVTDTETYTITFHLTKENDEWKIDDLSDDDLRKLSGLYGVTDVNTSIPDNTNDNTTDDNNGVIGDIVDDATDSMTDNNTDNNNNSDNNQTTNP